MAVVLSDYAAALYSWLKSGSGASSIRNLIQGGATNVLEAGDFRESNADTIVAERRTAGTTSKVLAVTVQDAGEQVQNGDLLQTVVVRVIDRDNGYRAIRSVRDLIRGLLDDEELSFTLTDVNGEGQGALTLSYLGRTGYRIANDFDVEYEALTFRGRATQEDL